MKDHLIMIIEDEADLRETIKEMLEISGFSVLTAENGREGLRLINEIGKPCLILLDLMMPVMNGWEFLERLKNTDEHVLSDIPVTVTSAAADVADVQRQYGCNVLKKPLSMERLVALAHEHCQTC